MTVLEEVGNRKPLKKQKNKIMKKIIILFIVFTPFVLRAQNVNGSDTATMARRNTLPSNIAIMDSLISQKVSKILGYLEPQRYKMYQTENIYNLLKLDTWTGRVWQVQWGDTKERVEVIINYRDLRDWSTGKDDDYEYAAKNRNGRFEMYPTKNMYTFILLDTYSGKTYQVQWSTGYGGRFCEPITD